MATPTTNVKPLTMRFLSVRHVDPIRPAPFSARRFDLGLVTIGAAYVPARRAAVLDPVEVLKTD
jgi:hypothetical protein